MTHASLPPKQRLDRFVHFCAARSCAEHTDIQTTRYVRRVGSNRAHLRNAARSRKFCRCSIFRECRNDNTVRCVDSRTTRWDTDVILHNFEPASFSLSFDNVTVELRGGHSNHKQHVLATWTSPRPLSWVRLLAVGVQFDADPAPHTFTIYRDVGQLRMPVLREYAIAAYFACCRIFPAYFSKVRILHIFPA